MPRRGLKLTSPFNEVAELRLRRITLREELEGCPLARRRREIRDELDRIAVRLAAIQSCAQAHEDRAQRRLFGA